MKKLILALLLFASCRGRDDYFYENDNLVVTSIGLRNNNFSEQDETKYTYLCNDMNTSGKHFSDMFVTIYSNNQYKIGDTLTITKKK